MHLKLNFRHSLIEIMILIKKNIMFNDNFSYFSLKPYVVTPHLYHLDENICFYAELTKNIPYYHQILPLMSGSMLIINLDFSIRWPEN